MARAKTNPSKIPSVLSAEEKGCIIYVATRDMTVRVWAAFLGTIIDFPNATSDSVLGLADRVKSYGEYLNKEDRKKGISWTIGKLQNFSGLDFHLIDAKVPNIRTLRDIKKFRAIVDWNAVNIAFATIFEPVFRLRLIDGRELPKVIHKTYSICQEIGDGELTLSDIAWALRNEFSISMVIENHHLRLSKIYDDE